MTVVSKTSEMSSFNPVTACYNQWWEETQEKNYRFFRVGRWATRKTPRLEDFKNEEVLGSAVGYESFDVLYRKQGCLIRVQFQDRYLGIFISGMNNSMCESHEKLLKEKFPKLEPVKNDDVSLQFWYHGNRGGGQHIERLLTVPSWGEIRKNYSEEVQVELDKLMTPDFRPSHGGQLILWQGPPGTGKTFAIRALVRQWAKWCDSAYIIDSEAFLQDATYMMDAMLYTNHGYAGLEPEDIGSMMLDADGNEVFAEDYDGVEPEGGYNGKPKEEMWRLLIIEDAGELLTQDAKERSSQAFSRLLNIADGLIGQGLKVLILITTNEEVKNLNDAIARPGRCASHIVFPDLTKEEANSWLEAHNNEKRVTKDASLAELFGEIEGFRTKDAQKASQKRRMGFGN